MIPKLVLKALTAAAANPEVRRRVIAAVRDPELRRQVVAAAGKGVESFRRWWAARESRKAPEVIAEVVPPKASKRKGTGSAKAAAPRAKQPKKE